VKIALAQINSTVGDLKGNAALITKTARRAGEAGAAVVAFPELAISGYPPEDLLLKDHFLAGCREALLQVAAGCSDIVALVGVPLFDARKVFNAAAVLARGKIVGFYRKICLPNYAVFDEKRYFQAGDVATVLDVSGVRLGVNVCEDVWDDRGPTVAAAVTGGAHVVVNVSMSPYHVGKGREREDMLSRRAREAGAYLCYLNGVGGQDELVFDGQSLVFDPSGRLVARARQFEEQLLIVELDPGLVQRDRKPGSAPCAWPVEVITVDAGPRSSTWSGGRAAGIASGEAAGADIAPPLVREAEVYAALRLGVRDYLAKNGFQKAVMGLSGGIDSALTACIAADALGKDRVTAVSMPSRYTSAGTKSDAQETAERLGIRFYEIPIESMYRSYLESLAPYFVDAEPGVTEQNIQARIRGNVLMALSNKFGWLVLTTGNKSEMAVGYATLYGDMAGGFAVLKDVPKTLVYRLAEYRDSLGPGAGPIPESTIARAPSAELAPDQVDQDTLPPYDILDRIIEAYVVRDDSVEEIAAGGLSSREVQRVVAMIDGNEYKRRQAPPGVRITPKAFGKDRRLPITNRYRG
jgi:NAD+ synthase (glutamine-hydrolysing)